MILHSQTWGSPASNRRILLLHGMGGTGRLWRALASGLESDWSVLAPDQRGHGQSRIHWDGKPGLEPRYTPLEYGADLVDTLQARSFFPAWVLGHSMGVRSAVALAHLKPEWVSGLILVDLGLSGAAGGGLGLELAQFIQTLPEGFANRAQARELLNANCPDPAIAQYLLAVLTPAPASVVGLPASAVEGKGGALVFPFDRSALIQTIQGAGHTSVHRWLDDWARKTGRPAILLRGAQSRVWSRADYEKERHQLAGVSNIQFQEWENCGHGLPFECRSRLVDLIRALN